MLGTQHNMVLTSMRQIWSNLHRTDNTAQASTRRWFFRGVFSLLCLLFAGPMAIVSSAANLDSFCPYWTALATWKADSPRSFGSVSSGWNDDPLADCERPAC
jgi:hypothetical protein